MRGAQTLFVMLVVLAGTLSISLVAPPAAAWNNVSVYMSGLDNPIALAFAPDGRIFFAERLTGNVRIIENNETLVDPFYTLENTTGSPFDERGLLGLALDPGFPTSPYVYAFQTFDDGPNGIVNRIVRIVADGNTGVFDSEIFRTPRLSGATNHNGGVIAFGPDDKLYALVGENADPSLSQDPLNPMGKVLRMNPDGSAPTDNPFYGNASWNPLVYTYGHRNMFGLAFHPISKGIFITENGPECNDEVNLLTEGGNFGWGPFQSCTPPDINSTNRDGPDPVLPVWSWARTICPTNAAVYNGSAFPAYRGDLFLGDCNTGTLHRLRLSQPNYDKVESDTLLWVAPSAILEVEAGPDGAIWVTTPNTIYRFWDSGMPPQAAFTASPDIGVVGRPVQFDASDSSDPDGTVTSYAWAFGDGTRDESGPTPAHIYLAPGRYNVTLTITDNESYSATASRELTVRSPPQARFTASPFPVAPNVPVMFDASDSSDSDGTVEFYEWTFGDGTRDAGVQTTHAYAARGAYDVTLTVTDNDNLTNTTTRPVYVGQPPTAAIAVAPSTIFIETAVHFSGTGSSDADGTVENWTWDFGDETTDLGPQVIHRFTEKGPFTVTLTVEDNDGLTNSTSTVVEVRNRPPAITSTTPAPGPVSLASGTSLTFTVVASDPDEDSLTYTWRVGDDAVGTASALTFVPPGPGVYTVNVTVFDGTSSAFREWRVTVATAEASGDPLFIGLVSVGVVLIGIGSAAAVVGWRRHRRKRKGQDGN